MPKMKTHRGLAKRTKVTGTGKVTRHKAYKSHILNKKSAKLMAAEKDGIAYVNVKEFYEGLGFKTQWQAESATISIGA